MARYYNNPQGLTYQQNYVPLPIDLYKQMLDTSQQRYDATQMAMAQEKARIGDIETYNPDEKQRVLDQYRNDVMSIAQNYNGDLSKASGDIVNRIGAERMNPYYNANRIFTERYKQQQQLADQLRAKGVALEFKTIKPEDLIANQNAQLGTAGRYNTQFDFNIQERLNDRPVMEEYFNDVQPDVVAEMQRGYNGEFGKEFIARVVNGGIPGSKIQGMLEDAMKGYRGTSNYVQRMEEYTKLRGMTKDDADKLIKEELLSAGMERVFQNKDVSLQADQFELQRQNFNLQQRLASARSGSGSGGGSGSSTNTPLLAPKPTLRTLAGSILGSSASPDLARLMQLVPGGTRLLSSGLQAAILSIGAFLPTNVRNSFVDIATYSTTDDESETVDLRTAILNQNNLSKLPDDYNEAVTNVKTVPGLEEYIKNTPYLSTQETASEYNRRVLRGFAEYSANTYLQSIAYKPYSTVNINDQSERDAANALYWATYKEVTSTNANGETVTRMEVIPGDYANRTYQIVSADGTNKEYTWTGLKNLPQFKGLSDEQILTSGGLNGLTDGVNGYTPSGNIITVQDKDGNPVILVQNTVSEEQKQLYAPLMRLLQVVSPENKTGQASENILGIPITSYRYDLRSDDGTIIKSEPVLVNEMAFNNLLQNDNFRNNLFKVDGYVNISTFKPVDLIQMFEGQMRDNKKLIETGTPEQIQAAQQQNNILGEYINYITVEPESINEVLKNADNNRNTTSNPDITPQGNILGRFIRNSNYNSNYNYNTEPPTPKGN